MSYRAAAACDRRPVGNVESGRRDSGSRRRASEVPKPYCDDLFRLSNSPRCAPDLWGSRREGSKYELCGRRLLRVQAVH